MVGPVDGLPNVRDLNDVACRGGQVTRVAQGDWLRERLTAGGLDLGVRVVVEPRVDVRTSVSAHLEPTRQKTLGTPHPKPSRIT